MVPMRLAAEVIGTAPIERLDVLHGANVVQTARPFTAADLGRRVRVTWQGAEYRGRETMWQPCTAGRGNATSFATLSSAETGGEFPARS